MPSTTPDGNCSSSLCAALDRKNSWHLAISTLPSKRVQYLIKLVLVSHAPSVFRFHSLTILGVYIGPMEVLVSMAYTTTMTTALSELHGPKVLQYWNEVLRAYGLSKLKGREGGRKVGAYGGAQSGTA